MISFFKHFQHIPFFIFFGYNFILMENLHLWFSLLLSLCSALFSLMFFLIVIKKASQTILVKTA